MAQDGDAPTTTQATATDPPQAPVVPARPDEASLPPHYPSWWEADIVLRDGSVAHVRPIVPDDAEAIRVFHRGQSEESIYLRFFAPIKELSERDVHRFTHVDYVDRVALVVIVRGDLIGIGRFDRLDNPVLAEVAFNISDRYQGKGIGSVLLEHLAAIGQEMGIERFVAEVLPQNRKMMKVFTDAGYEVEHHFDDGVIAVSFRIEPTEASQAVQLQREHRAEGQSIHDVLTPRSVAVIGVSRRPDAIGSMILDNIVDGGFTGEVYVVNSEAARVRGLKAYPTVGDIGADVDLAVIAVPSSGVLDVVDDCAAARVRALVVVSSGFSEAGPEGEERQAELLRRARQAGMRVLGPNSFGLLNNHPDVRLGAVLARDVPPPGRLGVFSQSAGIGVALLAACAERGLGLSSFGSAGNRVDISGNDLMQYWIDDDETDTVALYLESVGNPRKFSRIARQLSTRKPVVVVKSASSGQVPPGHRARTSKVSPRAFDAILEQAGVIRATRIAELVNICEFASHQPVPAGTGVAVLGNSVGMNTIILDAAREQGLTVTHGPVTLPLQCSATDLASAVATALDDPEVHALVVCLMPPVASSEEDLAGALAHATWGFDKPAVASFLGMRDVRRVFAKAGQVRDGRRRTIPTYASPLDGVRALSALTAYGAWRTSDHGERVYPSGVDRAAADRIVQGCVTETSATELPAEVAGELLATYGVHVWPALVAGSADEAVGAAASFGYPVTLRAQTGDARPGTVRADLSSEASVREAFAGLTARFGVAEVLVQEVAPVGVPTLLSSHEDQLFGPVITFGVSGVGSDLYEDLAYAVPPLTDVDIAKLLRRPKASALLTGYHGATPADLAALADLVARVSDLADDVPELAEVVLDPVIAHPDGVAVLGARVVVAPAQVRKDAGRRALS